MTERSSKYTGRNDPVLKYATVLRDQVWKLTSKLSIGAVSQQAALTWRIRMEKREMISCV